MSTPTKNSNNDNAHNSFKITPPVLTKEYGHSTWEYNLSIWEAFTSLEKWEQGLAIFFSLTGQDKQAARTISVKTLSSANGWKYTTEEPDKLYLKDESSPAYEAYKKIEKFPRPHEISLSDI